MTRPILILLAAVGLATSLSPEGAEPPKPFIRVEGLLGLAEPSSAGAASIDLYQSVGDVAFDSPLFDRQSLVAFEENRFFVYALGDTSLLPERRKNSQGAGDTSRLIRRFIFLKPSTFVIDDEIQTPGSRIPVSFSFYSRNKPEIIGSLVRFAEGDKALFCETLLPKSAQEQGVRRPDVGGGTKEYLISATPEGNPPRARFLHILQVRRPGQGTSEVRSELITRKGEPGLTVTAGDRVFRLTLPSAKVAAGAIAIERGGKTLIEDRPLPSGILPHGVEGVRLMEQWDADYRRGHPPLWDAGLPSGELRKVVEDGTILACRVVELGCGSGTDAVYLAGKGFDVTAIDIAPTALAQAQEKAHKAGVQVRWLLADVLAAPKLEPFDFIYDRGCYHEVRGQNLAAYLETVRHYAHAGTRFLLLAGSINETVLDYGPPRVAEEEIRDDFSALFNFEWVRESRFEVAKPGAMGPLAWSVLMRRKGSVGSAK